MSLKYKKNSFPREKSESLLASAGGTRSINYSLAESLKGTKGSKTITTHRTAFTLATCHKAFRILLTLVEFLAYLIVFAFYISKGSAHVNDSWIIGLSYLQCYFIMRIIIQSTMIIFCGIFYIEFILYTDSEWIKEVKSLKEQHKQKDVFEQYRDDPDSDPSKLPRRHVKRYRHKKGKNSLIYDCNVCSRLCSMKFCCRRCGVAISNVMLLRWCELHILCMFSAIYYFLSTMLRFKVASTTDGWSKEVGLYMVNDFLTILGITLPPVAYSLMLQLKMIYERRGSVSDITVAGSAWEKKPRRVNFTTTTMYDSSLCMLVHVSFVYMFCRLHFCEYN